MKNQPVFSNPGTLEDIVFENRNKAYGAYEINRRSRKYLMIAFFISLLGVSSAIAVPFIKAFKGNANHEPIDRGITVIVNPIGDDAVVPPPPTPPPPPDILEKQAVYAPPEVVDEPTEDIPMATVEDIKEIVKNIPVDNLPLEPVKDETKGIDEKEEPPFFVEESASFMGGGVIEFRNWVINHITYPEDAIKNGVFGKVIVEFTVNTNGEVTNIKFIRSLDKTVDDETRKVILSSPLWNPAKQGGVPVKQRFILPIMFQML
jgi:periplasmic protein TonB